MKSLFAPPGSLELRNPLGPSIFWLTVVNVVIDLLVSPRLASIVPPLLRTFKPAYFVLGASGEPSQTLVRIAEVAAYWVVSTAVFPIFMRARSYNFLLILGGVPLLYSIAVFQLPFDKLPLWVMLSLFSLSLAFPPALLGMMLRRNWLPWVGGLIVAFVLFRLAQQRVDIFKYPWVSASVVELCFSVALLKMIPQQQPN
ncbi:MAG: hypothetical protein M1453_14065 [Acidobacteria bacterium]|nr:hypothetical protein [Acidobacteriota bacterium]MCL5289106.1 hypothetical protein [Acidobacteriota bacterium]